MPIVIFSQDTINFKMYDSLKTIGEDNHKSTYEIIDSIKITKTSNKVYTEEELKYLQKHSSNEIILLQNDPDNMDVRMFRSINNSRTPVKTKILNTFDNSMLPVSLMIPPALFIYSRVKRNTYDENSAYLLLTSEITNFALTFGTKLFVKRKRPLNALQNVHSKGAPILDIYSFPSGHASTSFSMATMFALRYPGEPEVFAPMFAWALIISYARPYFGMHYPSDLLAGALIGSGSSILIYSLRKDLFKFKNQVLGEDKSDDGSINGGVVTFFAGAFVVSAIFDNFIFKEDPGKRFFISPWMDSKRGGLKVKWKF